VSWGDREGQLKKRTGSHVFYRDFTRQYPKVAHAEGVYLWDSTGKRYLDGVAGAAVVAIGHGVPEILEAMSSQSRDVCFAYAYRFTSEAQENLAAELASFSPRELDYSYFVSGGSEAIETAIKLARHYFLEVGKPSKSKIIARWRSYHGNTLGALSASGHVLRRREYGPYLLPFAHVRPPYRYRCGLCSYSDACTLACAEELEQCILQEGPDEVAAFMCEPIGGSSVAGMVPTREYYAAIADICRRYDVLFIVDEVLCGMGRSGRNFAIDHWAVLPDMIVCGKGLSSGYTPLGAVIVREQIYQAVKEGSGQFEHGFTYGGNPLSCAIGLAVLRYLKEHQLVDRAATMGDYLLSTLRAELGRLPTVGDIDGKALLVGVELVQDRETRRPFPREFGFSRRVAQTCLDRGVVVSAGTGGQADGLNGDRLMITPPYVISEEQLGELVLTVKRAILDVGDGLLSNAKVGAE
jgi:adenosylmethionine-8-amino-7-oxononanoate aminotransferase